MGVEPWQSWGGGGVGAGSSSWLLGSAWQPRARTLKAPGLCPAAWSLVAPRKGLEPWLPPPLRGLGVAPGSGAPFRVHLVGVGPAVLAQKTAGAKPAGWGRGQAPVGAQPPPLRLMWPEAFGLCPDTAASVSLEGASGAPPPPPVAPGGSPGSCGGQRLCSGGEPARQGDGGPDACLMSPHEVSCPCSLRAVPGPGLWWQSEQQCVFPGALRARLALRPRPKTFPLRPVPPPPPCWRLSRRGLGLEVCAAR